MAPGGPAPSPLVQPPQSIQPIFVQQLTLKQLQQMQQLNYLKESVPCVDYQFGFCMDGNKDCIFLHQKAPASQDEGYVPQIPNYKANECLPKEYLEKVKDYFDDSKITNVNMI